MLGEKRKTIWSKRSRMYGDKSFYDESNGHGRSWNRQKFFGIGFSNDPKYKDEKVSTPRPQGMSNESLWLTCSRCGKRHEGKCLAGRDGCFGCGESSHMKKDCPKAKATIREGNQVACSGGDVEHQKKNRFYALQSREDQE
ncbi:hypothetical protein MTR67_051884 [Solanum verrucosum]|uniref:CCHC-type domain-containing protein n=1 Tax=Solanum verrucosum TaxID=315347 RepID=A0AAF0V7E5_SOLVR|nr:hypothetical protein MTR67_051884 [Solanum verrucosum]